MLELWHLHRRAVLVAGGLLCGLIALLAVTGTVVHFAAPAARRKAADRPTSVGTMTAAPQSSKPVALASDAAQWDAKPAVHPAISASFPAIAAVARTDPSAFAGAFATQLFTRDYQSSSPSQLISWAQAEDAPLQSPNYPSRDWTKVLADSLTDLSWDGATQTPVPAMSVWQLLASQRARDTVSGVSVRTDPQWETTVANGYQPPDQLATVQDVDLRVTRQVLVAGHPATSSYDVSIAIQLGSSPGGGYGAAATNNFISKVVS